MLRRFLLGIMVVSLASMAWAGVPDLNVSTASIPDGAAGSSVFVLPNAAGIGFDEAFAPGGVEVDATITLTLIDTQGDPIFLFPFEDLWLESSNGSLSYCAGGTAADQSTDANGETTWSNPVAGGVNNDLFTGTETVVVMVAGSPLSSIGPAILFNSADQNGDLVVNLSDISRFTAVLNGAYNFAGDFNNDGIVNLSDIVRMTAGIGTVCN